MRLLRSFSRCFSSLGVLLLSSMNLKISASLSKNYSLSFAAADVVTCVSLLSFLNSLALLLEWNTIEPASSTWSGTCAPRCSSELCSKCSSPSGRCFGNRSPAPQVAAAAATISCIDFVCIFFIFDSHKRVWALILQSLPCRRVPFTAFLSIITSTGCRRPPVLTSMLELNSTTPLVCYFAAALHASPFDLLCYNFNKCAFCFCCCGVLSFDLIFGVISCVMYFIFFFWRLLFYCVNDFLICFLELGHFNIGVLYFFRVFNIPNRLMFFVFSPGMGVLFGRFDQESTHDTSMVTSHVDHVVGLSVLHIPQASSLEQDVINLFVPLPNPNSALKSPPMIGMYFLLFIMCFSIVLYIFSMWWSAYFECGKDTLINLMCWRLTKIVVVTARSLMYSMSIILFLHLLFNIIPTPCLLSYVPAPTKMCLCCVSHNSAGSFFHVSFKKMASHL